MANRIFDQNNRLSLAWNIVASVGLALIANLIIFVLAPTQGTQGADGFPPGWLVGSVWVVLFAFMGAARWLVATSVHRQPGRTQAIVALILFCVAYPFYTGMLTNVDVGLIGNIATVIAALAVAALCFRSSRLATALLIPVVCWTLYASLLTLRQSSFASLLRSSGQ